MTPERTHDVREDDVHDHDRGLSFDVSTLMTRRRALQLLAIGGLATVVGCGTSYGDSAATTASSSASGSTTAAADTTAGTTAEIPEETGGPYPADGSNGVNVLTESGIVRSDITSSFGSASGTAAGVPLAIALTILDVSAGGTPLKGAAVYLWHCNRDGEYSLYSPAVANENYLRGVQESDGGGTRELREHLSRRLLRPLAAHPLRGVPEPGARPPRPGTKLVTSQIALPEDACKLVYATSGYEQSVQNLAQTSLATDMVFSDGYSTQLGTVTGSVGSGMTVALNVGV